MQADARWMLVAALLAGWPAQGLPVLRFVLPGSAETLGLGGSEAFLDLRRAALRLERPALLLGEHERRAWIALVSESTLEIGGTHDWAGTRAGDFGAQSTVVAPFLVFGRPLVLAAGGRFDEGELHVRTKREGVVVDLHERRVEPRAAIAFEPMRWASLGVSFSGGGGVVVEGAGRIGPLRIGLVEAATRLRFEADAPAGPRRGLQRPALDYVVSQTRRTSLVTVSLDTQMLRLDAWWDLRHPTDVVADGALRWRFLALRGHVQSTRYAFDDWATNGGELVARVDLGVRVARWMAGVDAAFGKHLIVLRRGGGELSTASAWEDNGVVTARQFFDLEAEFDLYLRHLYRASVSGWTVGWQRTGEHLQFALGAQLVTADSSAGGLVYGSGITAALSGSEPVAPAGARGIVATGGVSWTRGPLLIRIAAAQLVPYASFTKPSATATPAVTPAPTTPAAPAAPEPSLLGKLRAATRTFDGGRLVQVEFEHRF